MINAHPILNKAFLKTHKDCCAHYCLLTMTETFRKIVDNIGILETWFNDLFISFDCILHDLIIGEWEAYGFEIHTLNPVNDYLLNEKQRSKNFLHLHALGDLYIFIKGNCCERFYRISILGVFLLCVYYIPVYTKLM